MPFEHPLTITNYRRAVKLFKTLYRPIMMDSSEPDNMICMKIGCFDDFAPELVQIVPYEGNIYTYMHLYPGTHNYKFKYLINIDTFRLPFEPIGTIEIFQGSNSIIW